MAKPAARLFRFAPSPNGYLHLGHALSAILNFEAARACGGRFLLRIEDTDRARARPDFEAAIYEDLAWLGLVWETPVRRQSEHFGDYAAALARLAARGLVYPCACTRGDIARRVAVLEAQTGRPWPRDPDGAALYPGTCRNAAGRSGGPAAVQAPDLPLGEERAQRASLEPRSAPMQDGTSAVRGSRLASLAPHHEEGRGLQEGFDLRHTLHTATDPAADPQPVAWRLDMARALAESAAPLVFAETGEDCVARDIVADPAAWGDVVLARKESPTSYHLAVTVDDALQGVTDVVRGRDLFAATSVHRLLQAMLGLPVPRYRHHRLVTDAEGEKLAKSRGSPALRDLRAAGWTPDDVRRALGVGAAASAAVERLPDRAPGG